MAVLIFADAPDPGNAERIRLLRTAFQALGATVTALPPVMPMRSFMFVGPLVSAGTTAHMKQFRSAIADHRLVVLVMAEARGADFGGPVLDQVASWCEAAGKPLLLVTGQLNVTVAALSNS
ncbi:MAG: hypothetical protein LBV30_10705, partial [Propionibacteriaceae bacterium]|nr:hypothetical protein [Propionibacteriaceae bacterium]